MSQIEFSSEVGPMLCFPSDSVKQTQKCHTNVETKCEQGNVIPSANVIASSQPECVPHCWTKLGQLAMLLTPKEALSETAVSFPLKENSEPYIHV